MSSLKRKLKGKKPPAGFDQIEDVIDDFERQLKEAVNEDTSTKRKNETSWKIHRLHWEKNRFIFDLMYKRKVMSKDLFEWLVREKVADGALIAKWRKPGYEILCSMLAIQKGGTNFGTTSMCRVPLKARQGKQRIAPNVKTGCVSCCSGDGRFGGPVWWNTPVEDEEEEGAAGKTAEARQLWAQGQAPEAAAEAGVAPPRKRPRAEEEEEEDDMPEEVKRRMMALREQYQREQEGGPGGEDEGEEGPGEGEGEEEEDE